MRLILVTDTFPPLNNSGAVQIRDLAFGFQEAGHQLTILVASPQISTPWVIEEMVGIDVVRVKTPRFKDVSFIRRGLREFMMPFAMMRCLKNCALGDIHWDGIIWYSPSIFFGPLISYLKKNNACKTYLIIRDIFPEWAFDIGLIKNSLLYFMLRKVAEYQYSLADTIGIQTPGNEKYFLDWKKKRNNQLEVLYNWISPPLSLHCSIDLSKSILSGKTIFVYAGNMGVAQNISIFLELALLMREQHNIGFLFVGRGTELDSLRKSAVTNGLINTLFYDEIESNEIQGLLLQCHIGLIALDQRHLSHNIPGKFLAYLNAGLPVLAQVNLNNDLVNVINKYGVGQVNSSYSEKELLYKANKLIFQIMNDDLSKKCQKLSRELFSTQNAVKQIISGLIRKD